MKMKGRHPQGPAPLGVMDVMPAARRWQARGLVHRGTQMHHGVQEGVFQGLHGVLAADLAPTLLVAVHDAPPGGAVHHVDDEAVDLAVDPGVVFIERKRLANPY